MNKYIAEFIGTATLVLLGCAAVTASNMAPLLVSPDTHSTLAILPIGLAFGLAVMAMAYGIGPVSGCHINPAVTLGVFAAGRMPASDVAGYIIAQFLGAIAGAGILLVILTGRAKGWDLATGGLGQNGWGEGYLGNYGLGAAVVTEFVATFLFLVVILGATSAKGARHVDALLRDDAQAGRLDLGVDRAREVALGRVGLEDRERALLGHGIETLLGNGARL